MHRFIMVKRLVFIFLSIRDMRSSLVVVAQRLYRWVKELSKNEKKPIAHLLIVNSFLFSGRVNKNEPKPSFDRLRIATRRSCSVQYVPDLRQDFLDRDPTHPQRFLDNRNGLFLFLAAALCFFICPALRAQYASARLLPFGPTFAPFWP